jgi:hypothetical protein
MDLAYNRAGVETTYKRTIVCERNAVPTAIPMASVPTSRKEIRRRVRRQVMLRRLSRELASGNDVDTVLRRRPPLSDTQLP